MKKGRERWMAVVALVVVGVLAGLVALSLQDARDRGRRALDRHQREAVDQFAATMESRVRSAFQTFALLAAAPFSLEPGDAADRALLGQALVIVPETRASIVVVDAQARVVNGAPSVGSELIGQELSRPGLEAVLKSGAPAMLPAAAGIAVDSPAFVLATPIRGSGGVVRGAHLFEVVISPDSDFSKEIAELGKAGGEYMFLDRAGTVLVSTDSTMLGRKVDDPSLTGAPIGLARAGGRVVVRANIPSADWRLVFVEDESAFESGLGGRIQRAAGLIVGLGLVMGGLVVIVLLRRVRAERLERRRMAEITAVREELVSMVSHEMRAPATGVVGFLRTTLDQWEDLPEDGRRLAVTRALANARRLEALTRDALDVQAVDAGELSYQRADLDLRQHVEAAVVAMREARPDRIFSLVFTSEPAWVHADGDLVQRVVTNLVDNAALHSPPDREIVVSVGQQAGEARVEVTDHGPDLAPAELEHVFDKFVRGRGGASRGSGLGLYVAHQIIGAHGGRMWARRADGGGATIAFALPLTPAPVQPVA